MSRRTRTAVLTTLPDVLPVFEGSEVIPPAPGVRDQIGQLVTSKSFDAWTEALHRVGNCSHPIKLVGRSTRVDLATGELTEYSSESEQLGVTHVRCGNRREDRCPSCARQYAGDMFQLIRAGVIGGKTVPENVGDNPLGFATVTAPSFGLVHTRCDTGPCRPRGRGDCRHGRPQICLRVHGEDDEALGQPLCVDCYDYASHLVWQWWAPDLWRRFTIGLNRAVASALGVPAARLGEVATVQYAKVAEYQRRGAIHFHTLVRLDGPKTAEGFARAPETVTVDQFTDLIHQAAKAARLDVPGIDPDDPARTLAFGCQLDVRPVRTRTRPDDPDRTLSAEQVAGYLAKYSTKSTGDTGASNTPHHKRLRATARALADRADAHEPKGPYELLGKWVHALGFRGHFATKSRRYSITLGALRRSRRRAQALIAAANAAGRPIDLAELEADLLADDDTETTLVIGQWQYVGTGWDTEAQRVLAIAAAARAREYDRERAEQRRSNPGERTTR